MSFPPYFGRMATKIRFIHYGFIDKNLNMVEIAEIESRTGIGGSVGWCGSAGCFERYFHFFLSHSVFKATLNFLFLSKFEFEICGGLSVGGGGNADDVNFSFSHSVFKASCLTIISSEWFLES